MIRKNRCETERFRSAAAVRVNRRDTSWSILKKTYLLIINALLLFSYFFIFLILQ